jgi:hypothetical protein
MPRVELVGEESVVARGVCRIVWFARHNDAWVAINELPNARVEQLDATQGTVWRTRVVFEAAEGTRLMRVETRPARRAPRAALDYLTAGDQSMKKQTLRSYFRVSPRGVITREPKL